MERGSTPRWNLLASLARGLAPRILLSSLMLLVGSLVHAEPAKPLALETCLARVEGFGYRLSVDRADGEPSAAFEGLAQLETGWTAEQSLELALGSCQRLALHLWHGERGTTLRFYPTASQAWAAYQTQRKPRQPQPAELALAATDEGRFARLPATPQVVFQITWRAGRLIISRSAVSVLVAPCPEFPREIFLEGDVQIQSLALVPAVEVPPLRQPDAHRHAPLAIDQLKWLVDPPHGCLAPQLLDGAAVLTSGDTQAARAALTLPSTGPAEILFCLDKPQPGTGVLLGDAHGQPLWSGEFVPTKQGGLALTRSPDEASLAELDCDPAGAAEPLVGQRVWLRLVFAGGVVKCWQSVDGACWASTLEPHAIDAARCATLGFHCTAGATRRLTLSRLTVRPLSALKQALDENKGLHIPQAIDTAVLRELVDSAIAQPGPFDARIALLDEAALVANTWADQDSASWFYQAYERLGLQLHREDQPHPFSRIAPLQLTAPVASREPIVGVPQALLRIELLDRVGSGPTGELADFCRQVRALTPRSPTAAPTLVDWAEARLGSSRKSTPENSDLRHPLANLPTGAGHAILAELEAAIASGDWQAACQTLSTADVLEPGLLPLASDPELVCSFAAAISLGMQRHPELQVAMREHFGQAAQLRVRRAIAAIDPAPVAAATLQFHGTSAAAEAHGWLGDRALSAGAFSQALYHYRAASALAGPELRAHVERAQAIATRLLGEAPHDPTPESLPQPAPLRAIARGDFQRTRKAGVPPFAEEFRSANIDWVARQCTLTTAPGQLLVNDRLRLLCFHPGDGRLRWQMPLAAALEGEGPTNLVPMCPCVTAERIFVRMPTSAGPSLACLDRVTGRLVWSRPAHPQRYVASDVISSGEELIGFTMRLAPSDEFTLALAHFEPRTGSLLVEHPLVDFRQPWPCAIRLQGSTVLGYCGGTTICCDLGGTPGWVRRHPWIPPSVDQTWISQYDQPPWLAGERVFVAGPGCKYLDCLRLENGRLLWRKTLPDIRRIVAANTQQAIAQTDTAVVAFRADTGALLWRRELPDPLDAVWGQDADTLLVAHRQASATPGASEPVLLWLDARSGDVLAQQALSALQGERPQLGPLVVSEGTLWTLFAQDAAGPNRQIIQLAPAGAKSPPQVEQRASGGQSAGF